MNDVERADVVQGFRHLDTRYHLAGFWKVRASGRLSSTDPLTNDTKALNVSSIILFTPSNPQTLCQPLLLAPLQECGHSSDRRVIESRPAGAQQCRNSSVRSREGAVQSAELLQQTTYCCCCCPGCRQRKVCRSEKTLTGTTSTTLACTLSSKLSAFPFEVKFSDLTWLVKIRLGSL